MNRAKKHFQGPIIFLIVTAMILLGYYAYNVSQITRSLKQEAVSTLSETTIHAAKSIQNIIIGEMYALNELADRLSKRGYGKKGNIRNKLNYIAQKNNYTHITIYNSDGKSFTSDDAQLNAVEEIGAQIALYGESYISTPYLDEASNEEMITFTSPIVVNGIVQAAVGASISVQDFYDVLNVSLFGQQGSLYIVDQKGQVILQPHDPQHHIATEHVFDQISTYSHDEEQLQAFKDNVANGQEGINTLEIDSSDYLIGYYAIEDINDWYVMSIISKDKVMGDTKYVIRFSYLLCLMTLVFLIAILFYILTSKSRNQKQIEMIAYVDKLTGIPSLSKFRLDAQHQIMKYPEQRFAIVEFNVDRFKYINEICGFEAGDQILMYIAKTISDNLLPTEKVGRGNGAQFILLATYEHEHELMDRMNNLTKQLSDYHRDFTARYRLVIKCGIYSIIDRTTDINIMIDRAEMACKCIKREDECTCLFFNEEMLYQEIKVQELVSSMHAALNNGEFVVYLQPKYDLKHARIYGAEALVRWIHPVRGLIPPGDFIPVFERNGFIVNLDLMVFEEVCRLLRMWIDKGIRPHPISVNISRMHLFREHFVLRLEQIIKKYDVPAEFIELELTESIVFENIKYLCDILSQLKKVGFSIAIDDFGTGYSSLNILQSIPADVIKLDRGFMMSVADDERGKIVVTNMINLATDLNMKVVVEGVETEEQTQFLRHINCDLAQGYYFAKPMPWKEYESLMMSNEQI
ncbi:bifunctional diguanylate cyclase/phosphodiesterase [Paenibacillus marinisediminis]